MSNPDQLSTTRAIPRLVVTPRSLADYRDMFVLSDADLTAGPILDCAGGASPFGAQVRARGGTVISVDPVYELPPDELLERVRLDIDSTFAWAATQRETLNWSYIGTPQSMLRAFETAADLFALDYAHHNDWYVAAELPNLPFPDRHFRLVLCSHLIFCYPQYLTFDEHVAALLELVRVCGCEVRVYPLVDTTGTEYPHLERVRVALAERGVGSRSRSTANTVTHPSLRSSSRFIPTVASNRSRSPSADGNQSGGNVLEPDVHRSYF